MTLQDFIEIFFYVFLFGVNTIFVAPYIVRALDDQPQP